MNECHLEDLLQNRLLLVIVDGSHKHRALIREPLLFVKPTVFPEQTLGAENSLTMVHRYACT